MGANGENQIGIRLSIYIAFGSNQALRDRRPGAVLQAAAEELERRAVRLVARSSLWHSPAWPDPSDPPYVNAVAEAVTTLSAAELMDCLHAVEAQLGRVRSEPNAPRTLDLDLIDYRGHVAGPKSGPILPHPRAHQRAFVLLPLQEIAPSWRHPRTGEGLTELVAALRPADISATRPAGTFERRT
jgi:2-amino-4-hydroxy-6-hydroxymethyldihydropteridine diphosphokinase